MSGGDAKLDWVERYLAGLTSGRKLSPHTTGAYRRDLHELATLAGAAGWDALGHFEIRRFTARLHAQGLGPRSIARKLSSWRGFFGWLALELGLASNPVEGVRAPRRAKTLPKALSVDDAVQLVGGGAHAPGHAEPPALCNRAMFELMYSSGLRVSELAGLDVHYAKAGAAAPESLGWIDLDAGEVMVTGKGGKKRSVPVGRHALDALRAWLAVRPAPLAEAGNALFLSQRGSRMTPRVVQLRMKTFARLAGTSVDVHPHVLRHSFASHVLQSSGDLRAVQELLGHASITSTQVYTALDFQHLAAVYDKAHPRAKSRK